MKTYQPTTARKTYTRRDPGQETTTHAIEVTASRTAAPEIWELKLNVSSPARAKELAEAVGGTKRFAAIPESNKATKEFFSQSNLDRLLAAGYTVHVHGDLDVKS